jgi:hypothetical protein
MSWSTILLKVAKRFPEVLLRLIENSFFDKRFLISVGIQISFHKNLF